MADKLNELLEEILKIVGLPYLSDLHYHRQPLDSHASAILMAIPQERYTLETWNTAASYVIGRKCCYKTLEEAKAGIAEGR